MSNGTRAYQGVGKKVGGTREKEKKLVRVYWGGIEEKEKDGEERQGSV